jgi:hypothetical protein
MLNRRPVGSPIPNDLYPHGSRLYHIRRYLLGFRVTCSRDMRVGGVRRPSDGWEGKTGQEAEMRTRPGLAPGNEGQALAQSWLRTVNAVGSSVLHL